MRAKQVYEFFSTGEKYSGIKRIAEEFNLTYNAVDNWQRGGVPYKWQRKLQEVTNGGLKAVPEAWTKARRQYVVKMNLSELDEPALRWLSAPPYKLPACAE